jgi:hypothetical protein
MGIREIIGAIITVGVTWWAFNITGFTEIANFVLIFGGLAIVAFLLKELLSSKR